MITNFLKKTKQEEKNIDTDNLIKITALLVHAAKIDDNYTANEKEIIADFLKSTKKNKQQATVYKKKNLFQKKAIATIGIAKY